MISKQEILTLAAQLQLQVQVVEKDYALGWFLAGIRAHPVIGPRWVFKGGTCLKKCFFETCPPFGEFWRELPAIFEWLNERAAAPVLAAIPSGRNVTVDTAWRLPAMVRAWGAEAASLETIRFAAANRLCVQLDYTKESGARTTPTIEPYSVRRTSAGDLLLFGVKTDTGDARSYRLDRIRSAAVTRRAFQPRYEVELTASGLLDAPPVEHVRAPS